MKSGIEIVNEFKTSQNNCHQSQENINNKNIKCHRLSSRM